MKLCKFCGEKLEMDIDHYDEYYYCKCEGQEKLNKINREIHKAEENLRDLKNQRSQHVSNSRYYIGIQELKHKIDILNENYEDDSFNPAKL